MMITKLRKTKLMKMICLLMAISIFSIGCQTETDNISLTASSSLNDVNLASFFMELDINSEMEFEDQQKHISSKIQSEFDSPNPWSINQAKDFKGELEDYFVAHNKGAFKNSSIINVSDSFLDKVDNFVGLMKAIESADEISTVSANLMNEIASYDDLSQNERTALSEMVNIYSSLSTSLISKYGGDEDFGSRGVKCRWYQWACVGAMTAAAVALIIASAGTALAPIIAGGATVAMVAACCFCRCRCSFTSSCQ